MCCLLFKNFDSVTYKLNLFRTRDYAYASFSSPGDQIVLTEEKKVWTFLPLMPPPHIGRHVWECLSNLNPQPGPCLGGVTLPMVSITNRS